MPASRSSIIGRFTTTLMLLSLFMSTAGFAYRVKTPGNQLDALVFSSASLRVTDTVADAGFAPVPIPNLAAINSMLAELGPAWHAAMELRTGRPTLIEGGAIPWIPGAANTLSWKAFGPSCTSNSCIPVKTVEALARQFLARYPSVFMLDGYDLAVDPDGSGPVWDSLYFLRFQPSYKGVPLKGSSVIFRINNGNLIQVVVDKVGTLPVDATPSLTARGAWDILFSHIGGPAQDAVVEPGVLEFVPVTPKGMDPEVFNGRVGSMLEHQLVWRMSFTRKGMQGTWEGLVDARTGELLAFRDANRYGHIHGGIRPSDGIPPEENRPFPWCDTAQTAPNNYSDGAGNFTGNNATSVLVGKYAHISDACGAISNATTTGDLNFLVDNAAGTDCVVPAGNTGGLGNTHSSRTMFYNLTAINLKAQIYNPTNTFLTTSFMTANVNGPAECNASSGGGTVNFYKHIAGSCNNLGEIPGVAMHEWAHSYDDVDGSGGQTPPLETYADFTAIIQTHNSCTGAGFLIGANCDGYGDACTACTGVRDCDYTKHASNTPWTSANHGTTWSCGGGSYNGPCGWEDHCESGISTQALWDFVYRDLTDTTASGPMYPNALDITSAWMLEDRLWFTGVMTLTGMYTCSGGVTDGCSGTVLYSVMRALDDDGDGTGNGTPHAHAIYHAMARHGMQCSTWNDTSAQNQNQTSCPALTTPTLSAVAGNNQAVLSWTTGGANATRYFVYRNESGCDVAFNRIAVVTAPTLTYTDNGVVNGTTYYYRIQAVTGNDSCTSPSSNCLSVTPQPCAASVSLNRGLFNCSDTGEISVLDSTPGSSPWTAQIWSTSDPTPRTVTLANNPAGSAIYKGTFTTTAGAGGAGVVHVANGDTLTAQFTDPDYCGTGSHAVTTTGLVDCAGPLISNVVISNVTGNSARVTWTTNETANSRVTYGTATPPGTNKDDLANYVTSHTVNLSGLAECTDYYLSVTSSDPATNSATDNNAGAYYTFSTGKNTQPTYTKTETPPLAIPDNNTTGASSVLAVTDSKTIQKVTVTINSITHTYDGDITIALIGPDATSVMLSNKRGGSGDNFTNTLFDDAATTAIASGTAPFTGSFIPDAPLSAFNGKNALGNWTLKVVDSASSDTGTIVSWSVTFTFPAAACGPHATYDSHAPVADTCSGTGGLADGIWDAGETVQFSVALNNDGTTALTGVTATVSSATPGMTFPDATASFAGIAVGATGTSQAPHFTAQLPTGLACGDSVSVHVVINSDQGTWTGDFTHTVGNVVAGGNITQASEDFTSITPPAWPAGWFYGHTGSGNDWVTYASGCTGNSIRYPYSGTYAADAWAYMPVGTLSPGVTYTLNFNEKIASVTWPERLEVKAGTGHTPSEQTITIFPATVLNNTACALQSLTFTVPAAGTYYIGFHCTSDANMDYLYVDDINLTYPQAPSCTMHACTPTTCTPPGAPALTGAAGTCSAVDLAWTAGSGVTNAYNVYRSDNAACPAGSLTKLNAAPLSAATLTYSDTTAVGGTSYTYVVRGACDASGAGESADSNCGAAARGASPAGAPAAPAVDDISGCAASGVSITWGAVAGSEGYDLQIDGGAVVTGVTSPYTRIPGDALSHTYAVRATSACGNSAFSPATAGTDANAGPPSVGTLTMQVIGADMLLSWVAIGNPALVDYYEVMRSLTPTGPFDVSVGTAAGGIHGLYLTLAAEPPTAYYKVRAVKGLCAGPLD